LGCCIDRERRRNDHRERADHLPCATRLTHVFRFHPSLVGDINPLALIGTTDLGATVAQLPRSTES
jgi:hypothetical protein